MRILFLYRPKLPSLRAQDIQVLHSAHAMARRGHRVTVLADQGTPSMEPVPSLERMGLSPAPRMELLRSPHSQPGLSGLWFRYQAARWWMGGKGAIVARDGKRLLELAGLLPRKHSVLLESHGLESALLEERGADPSPALRLEMRLLLLADCLVANCGGTMAEWMRVHGGKLPKRRAVVHNATAPSRSGPGAMGDRIRCIGSLKLYKGAEFYAKAAKELPYPLDWIGADPVLAERMEGSPNLHFQPPQPYGSVPDLLRSSGVLLLPLQNNLFGRSLTSPLKLWDYLATKVPIVAPDLPSIREIQRLTQARLFLHRPEDSSSLAEQARQAMGSEPREAYLRTWDDRAAEMEGILVEMMA
jgi:hypothetical protein